MKKIDGSPGHILDSTGYTYTVTPFDSVILKNVIERMYIEAGGEILYHSMLCGVEVVKNITIASL